MKIPFIKGAKKKLSIGDKLVLSFLAISLIPFSIAIYISYATSRKVLEEEVANSLSAVADNKNNQIKNYLDEKKMNVTRLSLMPELTDALEQFNSAFAKGGMDSPDYLITDKKYSPFLTYYQRLFGYEDLFLISSQGDILFSVKMETDFNSVSKIVNRNDSELAKVFLSAKETSKTQASRFENYPVEGKTFIFIASPVLKGGEFIGALAAQMSNQGLSDIVKNYRGLGSTGETMLVVKIKNKAVSVTPLRFDPNAVFKHSVVLGGNKEIALQKAVRGEEGSGIYTDYRGKRVLAQWRFIPFFNIGIVVKMDTSEVFVSADKLRNKLLTVSLLLFLIVVFSALVIARSISAPIKELTKVSSVITGGDLSARAKAVSDDEVGDLALSFNQMTDRLVQAKANVEGEREELKKQKALLEQANQELDRFVYTVSHDLRAPLRAISSFSTFLEEDYKDKLDSEGKDNISEIRKGVKRMSQLIDDLLTLSRISRIKNPFEEVDIAELVGSVVERIKFDVKEHKVDLKIQPGLPAIRCDKVKLGEVFLNLLTNAIKFSSKSSMNPKVEIGWKDSADAYEFYVKDNGIGIDPKYHKEIFGIFRRLHTSSEYEGTGAGLSIVKRIIEDHKGRIWVESEQGKGAVFHFTISKDLPEKS